MSEHPAHDDYARKTLEYAPSTAGLARLAKYSTAMEAELHAAALNAEGIPAAVFGTNSNLMNWLYQGFNQVELHVRLEDAERAAQIIALTSTDEFEPAPMPEGAAPPLDEEGNALVPVDAYENPRAMRDAQTLLASARIRGYAPPMMARGDRAPGVGKRFILRVTEDELDRAKSVLADVACEDQDEPRCPKCGSWRVYQHESLFGGLAAFIGVGHGPQIECLACHHRSPAAEFTGHSPQTS